MANLFLTSEEQGVVVFKVWQSLSYKKRILLSFAGILSGLIIQYATGEFFPGCILIIVGNLFLLVRGYDNRVDAGKYSPDAGWDKVDKSKFSEVEKLHRRMKKWDRSVLDITHVFGFLTFLCVAGFIAVVFWIGMMNFNDEYLIIAYDTALLLVPHWITGVRSILTKPNLILKIEKLKTALKGVEGRQAKYDVDYFMLMAGDEAKIPDDAKIRINIKNQHKDFLGLYGQVVTNDVNGTSYPYFYVVLVAKKGFGLKEAYKRYTPRSKITKEYKIEGDVEVFVIRQATTRTSGYHTNDRAIHSIFSEGIRVAETAALKK